MSQSDPKNPKKKNVFLQLPTALQYLTIGAVFIVLLVISELTTFGISYVFHKQFGKNIVPTETLNNFHPLFNRDFEFDRFRVTSEYDPYTVYRHVPYLPLSYSLATDRHGLVINKESDRERDLNAPKTAYRIFITGGSTIFGSNFDQSLAANAEAELKRLDPSRKYEVITGGVSGYASTQELNTTLLRLIYFQPDMVVTFDGVNDATASTFIGNYQRNDHMRAIEVKHFIDKGMHATSGLGSLVKFNSYALLNFLQRFYTVRFLFKPFEMMGAVWPEEFHVRDRYIQKNIYDYDNIHYRPEGTDTFLTNLESMTAALKVRGVKSVHILQPTLSYDLAKRKNAITEGEKKVMWTIGGAGRQVDGNKVMDAFSQFFNVSKEQFALRSKRNSSTEKWLDYTEMFADKADLSEIYYDYCHYVDTYTKVIGQKIAQDILPLTR